MPSARSISSGSSTSTSIVTWKLPSPTWPTIGAIRPLSAMSRPSRSRIRPAARSARRRRWRSPWRRASGRPPTSRRRGGPATACCAPPASSSRRTRRRRIRRRSRRTLSACSFTEAGAAVELEEQGRRLRRGRASNRRCRPSPAARRAARCGRPECRSGWSGSPRCRHPRPSERADAAGDRLRECRAASASAR